MIILKRFLIYAQSKFGSVPVIWVPRRFRNSDRNIAQCHLQIHARQQNVDHLRLQPAAVSDGCQQFVPIDIYRLGKGIQTRCDNGLLDRNQVFTIRCETRRMRYTVTQSLALLVDIFEEFEVCVSLQFVCDSEEQRHSLVIPDTADRQFPNSLSRRPEPLREECSRNYLVGVILNTRVGAKELQKQRAYVLLRGSRAGHPDQVTERALGSGADSRSRCL